MLEEVMIPLLKSMTGETDAEVLSAYLHLAARLILNRLYPFVADTSGLSVPERYKDLQVRIAAYLLNKRGAEGETAHSENGITRTYESGDVGRSLLSEITPYAGVPKTLVEVIEDEDA